MVECLILIREQEGEGVDEEALGSLSLANAKHVVVGRAPGGQVVVHVAATALEDLRFALLAFAQLTGVAEVVTLTLRTEE